MIVVEDKNFALFNYVNELNNQIEILQEQIVDIKKEIRRFEGQGVELEDKQRQMLEQINDKRSQATTLADEYEEKTRAARKILDQCRAGLFFLSFLSVSSHASFQVSIHYLKKSVVIVDKSSIYYKVMKVLRKIICYDI